ncbi:hypothetical protein [Croceicoccus hydrothermalis]|uniref:hypothetical protein n=1 Tax=Croceicoccus hydrothermalis TaxID=2867964 RepID=UPI001EFBDA3E|nr:hypothetical protein [Croceicoccus hydrothermalis]
MIRADVIFETARLVSAGLNRARVRRKTGRHVPPEERWRRADWLWPDLAFHDREKSDGN